MCIPAYQSEGGMVDSVGLIYQHCIEKVLNSVSRMKFQMLVQKRPYLFNVRTAVICT